MESSPDIQRSATTAASSSFNGGSGAGKKLGRQLSSRLQMRAPASIQIAPSSPPCVSEWNVAIPLLSPLDIACIPLTQPSSSPPVPEHATGKEQRWLPGRQHPAAPFYCEPPPANAPPFALPHCA